MNQQIVQQKKEDRELLLSMDKFFIYMSVGYLFVWFVSLPFFRKYWDDSSHGGFFDHIGFVAFLYLAVSVLNYLSKAIPNQRIVSVLTFVLFGFFMAFPLLGSVGAVIVSVIFGLFAFKKETSTNFVTGALAGYWLMLLIVSTFEYNPFAKIPEGFSAFVFEGLAALWNMANYQVHDMTLSWFFLVPIGIGYFILRTFEEPVETIYKREEVPASQEEQKEEQKEVPVAVAVQPDILHISSDSNSEQSAPTKKRYKKEEKPNKRFFSKSMPATQVKVNNWREKILRNLSR